MSDAQSTAGAPAPSLFERFERLIPIALPIAMAAIALPLVGSFPSWVTLTLAGLAMGMMIFLMASGLTLVFGLMDVINFGHGAFISVGAFIAVTVVILAGGFGAPDALGWHLLVIFLAISAAMIATGALGVVFERIIIRPVYGNHLKQILVTMGGLIVIEELIRVLWGPDERAMLKPETLRGSFAIGDIVFEKYRLLAVLIGLIVFLALFLILQRTKIGLLIRAGVENSEMVEALGYRIGRIFTGVFIAGSALAGLGGVMWAFYEELITAGMGMHVMVLVFIVIIIGGLGSVGGCFLGALLVGLMANYTGFLLPKLSLGSNILLMVPILMWRPRGLYSVGKG